MYVVESAEHSHCPNTRGNASSIHIHMVLIVPKKLRWILQHYATVPVTMNIIDERMITEFHLF